jgi:hypothetical protein
MARGSTKPTKTTSDLRQLVDSVRDDKQARVVEENGEVVAVVIPADDLGIYRRARQRSDEIQEALERFREPFKDIPPEEIEREIDKAVAEVRAERRAEAQARKQ